MPTPVRVIHGIAQRRREKVERDAARMNAFVGEWFEVGPNQQLHLVYDLAWIGSQSPLTDRRHFALRVDDLDAAREHINSCGWPTEEASSPMPGARRVFL